jgi:hypothetical protein
MQARFRVRVEKKRNDAQIALDGRILQLPRETGIWESEIDELGDAETALEMIKSLRYPLKQDLGAALGYLKPDGKVNKTAVTRLLDTIVDLELSTYEEIDKCFEKAKKHTDAKKKNTNKERKPEDEWAEESEPVPGQLPTSYDPERTLKILQGLNLG